MKALFIALMALGLLAAKHNCGKCPANIAQTSPFYGCGACTTPAPTPTPAGIYVYSGVQVYNGTAAAPDSIINANISAASVDTNSATVLAAQSSSNVFPNASEANDLIVNVVTTPTPTPLPIATATSGHNPPITVGVYGGGTGWATPWIGGTYKIEGTCTSNCSSDAHVVNIILSSGCVIQGGGWNWNGTVLSAFDGYFDCLGATYCSQISNKGDNGTVAGIPLLGWTLFGDDLLTAATIPINHPTGLIVAVSSVASGTAGVNYSTLGTNSVGSCSGNDTTCFRFGDILRLKASVNCAGLGDAMTQAVCVSWQKYGLVVNDLGAQPIPRYGLDVNGTDDASATLLTWQHSLTLSANFELIARGSVHC